MKFMPSQAKKLAATLKRLRLPDQVINDYVVEVQKAGSIKLKALEMKVAEGLIKKFPERFGWTNTPNIAGSLMVEAGTGIVAFRENNQPIMRPSKVIHKPVALIIKEEAEAHLRKFEGFRDHMYLDGNNEVTIGIGHHVLTLQDAWDLPFAFRDQPEGDEPKGAEPVTQADITADWNAVLGGAGRVHAAADFQPLTNLRIEAATVEALFDVDFLSHRADAARNFPLTTYPKSVQLGIVDLTYVLGLTRLLNIFVKFQAALKRRDFVNAAKESAITKGSFDPDRNAKRKELITLGIKSQPFFTTSPRKTNPLLKFLMKM